MSSKIICFAGSLRQDSINKQLARCAAVCAELKGASAEFLDLRDYAMPLYDGDLETAEGVPAAARALTDKIDQARALIIATPEYNGATPAVLKNTLDWVTRVKPEGNQAGGSDAMRMKPTLMLSASPGGAAGSRTLVVTRLVLSHLGLLVIPSILGVGNAGQAFTPEGQLVDTRQQQMLDGAIAELIAASRG